MSTDVWKALSDPTRRSLLDRLKKQPQSTGDLCEAFDTLDRCTVMKHLEVLVGAGLVVTERQGRNRINHMNAAPLQEIVERWVSGHTAVLASAALRMKRRLEEKMQSANIRQLVVEVPIKAPLDQTWKMMLEELPQWWPSDFLCFPESKQMRFEPFAGGRLYEETPEGSQILWAQVLSIVPRKGIDFVGYMTPAYGGPSITMYGLELEDKGDGQTTFRLSNSIVGRVDEEQEASMREGWDYLFGKSFREYVETRAGA